MKFNDFQFNNQINKAISKLGYTVPTPVQQHAIGPILQGKDILGIAQTGTGKTAAFMLPTVQRLLTHSISGIRVLVLAPTRELAEQIQDFTNHLTEGTRLKSLAVYGGVSKQKQVSRLRAGVDIVIACPGRLLDLVHDGAVNLASVEVLILDEADHMLDKGFLPDLRRIIKLLPTTRQSLVFSATMPGEIQHLTETILKNPVKVQIAPTGEKRKIAHKAYMVEQPKKTALLLHLLNNNAMSSTLIFTRTKYKARNLANRLEMAGFKATSLQGNLSQNRRQQALDGFKDGTFSILVATDIAARGIDVDDISHVINFDMPDTTETYIHRSGRTGRAMRSGIAWSFVTAEDMKMRTSIERVLAQNMTEERVALPKSKSVFKGSQEMDEVKGARQPRQSRQPRKKTRTKIVGKSKAQAGENRNRTSIFGLR